MTIILSNLNRFKKFLSLEDSLVNLQLGLNVYEKSHRTLHILLHYLVKHYCQQNKPLTKVIINKGSVATYIRCGGVVNN